MSRQETMATLASMRIQGEDIRWPMWKCQSSLSLFSPSESELKESMNYIFIWYSLWHQHSQYDESFQMLLDYLSFLDYVCRAVNWQYRAESHTD